MVDLRQFKRQRSAAEIADHLAMIRHLSAIGATQRAIAERVGVSVSTVSRTQAALGALSRVTRKRFST